MEQQNHATLGYEYAFRILIDKVSLCTGVPCSVKLLIRRGSQKIKSQQSAALDGTSKYGFFQELLSLKTKVYCDSFSSVFWDKKISFTLLIETPSGSKLAGVANYNLASLLNGQSSIVYEVLKLHKCPDPNAKIFIRLEKQLLSDLGKLNVDASQQSLMSEDDDFLDITFSNDSQNNIILPSSLQQQTIQQDKTDNLPLKSSNFSFSNNHQQLPIDSDSKKNINQLKLSTSSSKQPRNDENIINENRINTINTSNSSKKASQLSENEKILALEEHAKMFLKEKKIMKKELQDLRNIVQTQNNLLSMKNHENDKLQEDLDAMRAERDELKWLMDELKKNADNIEGQIFSKFELMKQDFSIKLSLSQERERYLLKQNEDIQMKVKQLIQDNNSCTERALIREKEIFELKQQINYLQSDDNCKDYEAYKSASNNQLELQDTLQKVLLENKYKDEQIERLTHTINSCQVQMQKQVSNLNAQDAEDQPSSQIDQFRPADILNAKSFLSNTFNNDFHSCIIQDFKDYGDNFEMYEPDFLYTTPREPTNNKYIQNEEPNINKISQETKDNINSNSRQIRNNA